MYLVGTCMKEEEVPPKEKPSLESKEHVKLEIQIWKHLEEKRLDHSKELVQNIPVDFFVDLDGRELAKEILRRALKFIKQEDERFEFHKGKKHYSIPYKDILFFCSDKRSVRVITKAGEFEYCGTMKELMDKLPRDFIIIHKSYVVNVVHLIEYSCENVCLSDGTRLPVSKPNRSKV